MTEQHKKFDEEKVMLDLVEPGFIEGVGKVLTFGATKYGINNWKLMKPEDKRRCEAALMRHINEYRKGNKKDEEDQEHLMCAACQIMFMYFFDNKEKK